MSEISPVFLFVFILLVTASEFFLSLSWSPLFFRFGIPLLRKEFQTLGLTQNMESYIGELENQLPRSWQQPAIAFKSISRYELAFRQKFGQRNPAHGILVYEPAGQRLSLTGYMPWSTLSFPFVFIFIMFWAPLEAGFFFLFVFILGLVFAILMPYRNYGRIAKTIAATFQEQRSDEYAGNLPQSPEQLYAPDISNYEYEYDSYPSANKKGTNSNSATIIAFVVVVTLLSLMGIAGITFFLLTAGS